jgi:hypothetical protein
MILWRVWQRNICDLLEFLVAEIVEPFIRKPVTKMAKS